MVVSIRDLTPRVRALMLAELDDDIERDRLYISSRLTPPGIELWPSMLRQAIDCGDHRSLAAAARPWLHDRETQVRRGRIVSVSVPYNANETLAEDQFNRFFIRALARVAIEDGVGELEVYRAKPVAQPRWESERLIGTRLPADRVLADLRAHRGVDTALGVPGGPNSGLSVRIPPGAAREPA